MSTLYFADVAISPSFFFTSSLLIAYHLIVPIGAAIAFKRGTALRVWSLLCTPLIILHAYLTATEPTFTIAPFAGLFYFALAMVAYQLTSVPPAPISLLPGPVPEDQETQGAVEVQEERSLKDLWFGDLGAYPWGSLGILFAVVFVLLWVVSATLHTQSRQNGRSEATAMFGVKRLSDGASAYYDEEHSSKAGMPLPSAFPCANKGWHCYPTRPHCQGTNEAGFSKKEWRAASQQSCFHKLKFSPGHSPLVRFCYMATGSKKKATFAARVEKVYSCGQKMRVYTQRGYIDADGEVTRGQLKSTMAPTPTSIKVSASLRVGVR